MGKKRTTKSAEYTKKRSGAGETWTIRRDDGRYETVTTTRKSSASMDKAVKRYSGALKRLAER
jgi:hypothetical protein